MQGQDGDVGEAQRANEAKLETVFGRLSDRLDALETEAREVFLVKAFLLLADAHDELATVLACLEEAAGEARHGRSDTEASL